MKSADLRLLLARSGGRRLFLKSLFAAAFWSTILIANAVLIAEVVTRTIGHQAGVTNVILGLTLIWLLRASFQSIFERWTLQQAIEIKRNIRQDSSAQIGSTAALSPAELSTLLIKGLNALDVYVGRFIPQLIFAMITPAAIILTIFTFDPLSAVIAFLTLPLIPLFGALIGRYSADAVQRKWKSLSALAGYFEDSLRGFATLKIFGRSKGQSERIQTMGDRYTSETMKVLRVSFLSAFALELVATLSVAVIAVSVGLRLVSGGMEFKPSLIILILAPEVYFPLRNAASLFHASEDGTQALREVERLFSKDIPQLEEPISLGSNIQAISWKPWTLARAESESVFLKAARVAKGQMLFISGESGIGKTTFANNLLGMTFSAEIAIEIDSRQIELIAPMKSDWQRNLGWIPQNPQLAAGTVRDQFTLLIPEITDEQISQALRNAGLDITELPDGLNTSLGKGGEIGSAASGGQVRRIAVARALIRQPSIVIADEPTADLDSASAKAVMKALRGAQSEGAIVICITHDESLAMPDEEICRAVRSKP